MATSANVNIRTTKLNQPNRFTLTRNHRTLFDLYLTDDEMTALDDLVGGFVSLLIEGRNGE